MTMFITGFFAGAVLALIGLGCYIGYIGAQLGKVEKPEEEPPKWI